MTTPRKRTITIRLTLRDKTDPKAILQAVREALEAREVETPPVSRSDEPPVPEEGKRRVAMEHLEAAAIEYAAAFLEAKAQEIQQQNFVQGRRPATPSSVVKARKQFFAWFARAAKAGWRVTVEAALDWVKKQVTGQ